jgi:hypothetical protein
MEVLYTYTCEDNIMKPTKHFEKWGRREEEERKYKGEGDFLQSTLYPFMDLSQRNPSYYQCMLIKK